MGGGGGQGEDREEWGQGRTGERVLEAEVTQKVKVQGAMSCWAKKNRNFPVFLYPTLGSYNLSPETKSIGVPGL